MKLEVFDVVKLKNGDKATILAINKHKYKVEIVDDKGVSRGIKNITVEDIDSIIISK